MCFRLPGDPRRVINGTLIVTSVGPIFMGHEAVHPGIDASHLGSSDLGQHSRRFRHAPLKQSRN